MARKLLERVKSKAPCRILACLPYVSTESERIPGTRNRKGRAQLTGLPGPRSALALLKVGGVLVPETWSYLFSYRPRLVQSDSDCTHVSGLLSNVLFTSVDPVPLSSVDMAWFSVQQCIDSVHGESFFSEQVGGRPLG